MVGGGGGVVGAPSSCWGSHVASTINRMFSSSSSSSSIYESPIDELLDPDVPCPVFGTRKDAPLKRFPTKFLECGLDDSLLRFRTSNYGRLEEPPYVHQNEHRVTLLIYIKDLPLDGLGKQILQQVIGINRYNVERGQVKLQANYFPSRIENKRYLVRIFDKLILACQRLSKSYLETGGPPETDPTADVIIDDSTKEATQTVLDSENAAKAG